MQLIARISVRRHLIEGERELRSANSASSANPANTAHDAGKSVTVFRVLGRSPERALKLLAANTGNASTSAAPVAQPAVALTFASDEVSEDQAAVCKAVIAQCRSRSMEIVLCGRSPQAPADGRARPSFGNSRWFPSVQEMVQQFGKEEPRYANQTSAKAGRSAP